MSDTADASQKCPWCGKTHFVPGKCPEVKAFEYHPDGSIKRVEFYSPNDYAPTLSAGAAPFPLPLKTGWDV